MRFHRNRQRLLLLWLLRRRRNQVRRYYIRPAHHRTIPERFELFYRYYRSEDPNDLKEFLRFTPDHFDQLYDLIDGAMINHPRTHRFPISKRERLAIFLRCFNWDFLYIISNFLDFLLMEPPIEQSRRLFTYIIRPFLESLTKYVLRFGHPYSRIISPNLIKRNGLVLLMDLMKLTNFH